MKKTENYTFFSSGKDIFSKMHYSPFVYKERTFYSCAHFMAYCKAMLGEKNKIAENILQTTSSRDVIALEKKVHLNTSQRKEWKSKRLGYALIANREKYMQNQHLFNQLLLTGNTEIVEATDFNKFWDAGLTANNPKILEKKNWKGENNWGKIVTKVRDELKLKNYLALKTTKKSNTNKNKQKL